MAMAGGFEGYFRIVPNYELAPDLEKVEILRVVVRESMTEVVSPGLVTRVSKSDECASAHRSACGGHCKWACFARRFYVLIHVGRLK